MNKQALLNYRCPVSKGRLLLDKKSGGDDVSEGVLRSEEGRHFPVRKGIPDFTYPETLVGSDAKFREDYDRMADGIYDNSMDWLFDLFCVKEADVRDEMIDLLALCPGYKVLEIGCGTGRDSVHIARRLGQGQFFAQDLSAGMLGKCRERIEADKEISSGDLDVEYFVGNASYLPFPDNYFDAVFHFGGLNEFTEGKEALEEISRVVRKGAKVVVGDESVAPWLRETDYGKVLINNNSLWGHHVPLEILPKDAWNPCLRWILGNAFYVIDYEVGDGLPPADFDLIHQSPRGGSCNTRYYGQLEGVSLDVKSLAWDAARKSGKSMHEWLDNVVRQAAESDMGDKGSN